ncbi:unnamed protein product [Adineta steineri]|uniref:Uncharacterized protein n=1 Tax=Adineta steineri TaxID=433720 RepID=A0A818X6M7_9BILA|nr:unnamed protein product [Adineta steineri]CAF3732925.1 unnamed protein product [Adineta steineri]
MINHRIYNCEENSQPILSITLSSNEDNEVPDETKLPTITSGTQLQQQEESASKMDISPETKKMITEQSSSRTYNILLFLVEKSLANMNYLICLLFQIIISYFDFSKDTSTLTKYNLF